MKAVTLFTTTSLLSLRAVNAFVPVPSLAATLAVKKSNVHFSLKANNSIDDVGPTATFKPFEFTSNDRIDANSISNDSTNGILPLAMASTAGLVATMPLPAEAATATGQIPSALVAYAHYLSLFAIVGLITYERFTVEAGMSKEKEINLALTDIGIGISGVAIVVSGYYRATQYGKGWDFYSHEPIFWLKMIFLCIFGAASLFPTTTFIKRSVAIQSGKDLEPMSEKLAARLQQVLTAELVMVASIPLAATLMVRFSFILVSCLI